MAFEKRTWLARIGAGLNKFIIGNKDGEGKQTLTNSPDSVTQQGDVISAENLNDLEDRIDTAFGADSTRLGNVETAVDAIETSVESIEVNKLSTSDVVSEQKSFNNPYTGTSSLNVMHQYSFNVGKTGYKVVGIKAYGLLLYNSTDDMVPCMINNLEVTSNGAGIIRFFINYTGGVMSSTFYINVSYVRSA